MRPYDVFLIGALALVARGSAVQQPAPALMREPGLGRQDPALAEWPRLLANWLRVSGFLQ